MNHVRLSADRRCKKNALVRFEIHKKAREELDEKRKKKCQDEFGDAAVRTLLEDYRT